jgi:hypothetical protein
MKTITKSNRYNVITHNKINIFKNTTDILSSGKYNIIIPHVCNNMGVFGAGFAKDIGMRFPEVCVNFEMLGSQSKLGSVQYIKTLENKNAKSYLYFANMIAQNKTISNHNPRPLNYEYLVKCMVDVRQFATNLTDKTEIVCQIHCPMFGSGLAGGNWLFIKNLIEDIWFSFDVCVYSPETRNK